MFTGIIRGIARIVDIDQKLNFRTHVVELPTHMLDRIDTGSSVAHNGCCLTVTKINGRYVSFDLMKETLKITNLSELKEGDLINVERAAKFGDEIGGHLMSGHIITTAEVEKIIISDNNYQLWFKMKILSLMKYILYKGFVGVDGISLTIGDITSSSFCVYLIPETLQRTTLRMKKTGQSVNVEIDTNTQTIVDTIERVFVEKMHI